MRLTESIRNSLKEEYEVYDAIVDKVLAGEEVYVRLEEETEGSNIYQISIEQFPISPEKYDEGYILGWDRGADPEYDKEQDRKYEKAKEAYENGDVFVFDSVKVEDGSINKTGFTYLTCYGVDELIDDLRYLNAKPLKVRTMKSLEESAVNSVTEYTILFNPGEYDDLYGGEFITEDKDEADELLQEIKEEGKIDQVDQYFSKEWVQTEPGADYEEGYVEVFYSDRLDIDKIGLKESVEPKSNLVTCRNCGEENIDLSECETDYYWTNDGDRVVYHKCPYCGEPLEDIDFGSGSIKESEKKELKDLERDNKRAEEVLKDPKARWEEKVQAEEDIKDNNREISKLNAKGSLTEADSYTVNFSLNGGEYILSIEEDNPSGGHADLLVKAKDGKGNSALVNGYDQIEGMEFTSEDEPFYSGGATSDEDIKALLKKFKPDLNVSRIERLAESSLKESFDQELLNYMLDNDIIIGAEYDHPEEYNDEHWGILYGEALEKAKKDNNQKMVDKLSKLTEAEEEEYHPNGVIDDIKRRGTGDTDIESPMELNTNVLPLIDAGIYGREDMIWGYDEETEEETGPSREDLVEAMKKAAQPILEDALREVLPSASVVVTGLYSPQYYNYETDQLEFTVSFDTKEFENLMNKTVENPKFDKYLNENYSSRSGFFSYLADNVGEFWEQDGWKKFVQVIMFYFQDEVEQEYRDTDFWDNTLQYTY